MLSTMNMVQYERAIENGILFGSLQMKKNRKLDMYLALTQQLYTTRTTIHTHATHILPHLYIIRTLLPE